MGKRDVSAIVSGAGLLTSIFTELVEGVHERGGTDEDIHRLATPQGKELIGKIAELIVANRALASYEVLVNHDLSFVSMLRRAGFDGYVNPDITEAHFPLIGEGEEKVIIEPVHFNKVMTNDEVTKELDQRGLRDATLPELLALSTKFKDLQREFPIVARGSVWRDRSGSRSVPCAWGGAGARYLLLFRFAGGWDAHCRFACARK